MDIIRMNCQSHDKWILHFALTLTKNLQFSRSSKRVQCHIGKADSSEGLAKHKQSFVHLWNICCYSHREKKEVWSVFLSCQSFFFSALKLEFGWSSTWCEKLTNWIMISVFMERLLPKKIISGNSTNFPFYSSYRIAAGVDGRNWNMVEEWKLFIASRSAD